MIVKIDIQNLRLVNRITVSISILVLLLVFGLDLSVNATEVVIDDNVYSVDDAQARKNRVMFVNRQIGYVFFADENRNLVYRKTRDGGLSWDLRVSIASGINSTGAMIWYDRWTPGDTGTIVHIMTINDSTDDVIYTSLDITNDQVSNQVAIDLAGGGSFEDRNRFYISKSTDGTLYFGLMDNTNNNVRACANNCGSALSWTSVETNLPFRTRRDGDIILLPLPEANMMAIHWDDGRSDIASSVFNSSTGVWSDQYLIDGNAKEVSSYKSSWGATLDPNTNKIYLVYSNEAGDKDNDHRTWIYDPSTSLWTGGVFGSNNDFSDVSSVSFNPDTQEYYPQYLDIVEEAPRTVVSRTCSNEVTPAACPGAQYDHSSRSTSYRSISSNLVNNQIIYATWFDTSANDLRGILVDEPAPLTSQVSLCLEPDPFDSFTSSDKVSITGPAGDLRGSSRKSNLVFISKDIGYLFYIEHTTKDIVYKKTFDGGLTWVDGNGKLEDLASAAASNLAVWYDRWTPGISSTKIHIAIGRADSSKATKYIEFSPGATGIDQWTVARTINSQNWYDTNSTSSISIAKTGDGSLFITMSGTPAANPFGRLFTCQADCAESGTWTQVANYPYDYSGSPSRYIDGTSYSKDDTFRLVPVRNNKLLILNWRTAHNKIHYTIHEPGTTNFLPSEYLGDADDSVTDYSNAWGVTYDKSRNETYLCYNDDTAPNDSAPLSNIRTAVFTDQGIVRTGVAVTAERNGQCDLAYDETTGATYLIRMTQIAGASRNEKVFVMKSTDGMQSWSYSVQLNKEPATDTDGGADYRQVALNFSSPDRIYASLWQVPDLGANPANAAYWGVSIDSNRGQDRLNPRQSQADWFHFLGF